MIANSAGPGSLTKVERDLVASVERGEVLDLAGDEPVDEEAMRAWGPSRTIRSWVLRDILRGGLTPDPDPRGLRLKGARIAGRVDLDNVTSTVAFTLRDCFLDEGITACNACLVTLALHGCRLEHPTEIPLDGSRLVADEVNVSRTTVTAHHSGGAIALATARIGRRLTCRGAVLTNDSGPALYADGLQAEHSVFLDKGFSATGTGGYGAVNLLGAHIGSQLNCSGAVLANDSGPALSAGGLQTGHSVSLDKGFSATGTGEYGAVNLLGAHIGGQLICNGATMRSESGPALDMSGLQAVRGVFLDEGFSATGTGHHGTISLIGAHIGAQLACHGAVLTNDSGPAINADNLQTEHNVYLDDGFSATGTGDRGAVNLLGARIGGQLSCRGAVLANNSGPALNAVNLTTEQSVFLITGSSATGTGKAGAINLTGACIGGQLACNGAVLSNDAGPALNAWRLKTGRGLVLVGGFSGAGDGVVVDLGDAHVGGELVIDAAKVTHSAAPQRRFEVDGLVYAGLPQLPPGSSWLWLLEEATPRYAAQPYQHLAAVHRAAGHDREARQVLIRQREDQIRRHALTGRAERAWARLTGLVLGYGYQPWRALLGLLATLVAATVVTVVLGAHGALARVHTPPDPAPVACALVDQVGVGLDLGTPLVSTGARTRCDATSSATGQALTVTGWALRLLAWGFATLFIAGFTGAVRKT